MTNVFESLVKIVSGWGLPIGALALIFCGIKYATSSDQQSAAQAKSWFIRILVGMIVVFAANIIMAVVKRIGEGLDLSEIQISNGTPAGGTPANP